MTSDKPAPTVKTPDGETGIIMQLTSGGNFRILRDMGMDVENVAVTPVQLPSGEIRFYTSSSLGRA